MNMLFCDLKNDLECCQKAPHTFHLPYGLGIIMHIAIEQGVSFDYFNTYLSGDTKSFEDYYREHKQDVVLFSGTAGNYTHRFLKKVFQDVRAINPGTTIVLGGPITSIYPEMLLNETEADILVIGEGERTFIELLDADFSPEKLHDIRGIGFKDQGHPVITPVRPPLGTPLESETCDPLYEHEVFKPLLTAYVDFQKERNRGWDLHASRGCFGRCTYCNKLFSMPIRHFSNEYLLDVMTHIREIYGMDRFSFLDENFVTNKKKFLTFLDMLEERNMNIKWRIKTRIDNLPYEYIDRMQQLGLYNIMVGLESANQDILDGYKKDITIAKYRQPLKEVAKRGLLSPNFILGALNESEKSIQDNIDFIKYLELKRENLVIAFLNPIPGTEIYSTLLDKGLIPDEHAFVWDYVGNFLKLEYNYSPLPDQVLLDARDRMMAAAV